MADCCGKIVFTSDQDGKQITTETPVSDKKKIVIVINNQWTNAPNTTQIASGAGRSSAAGNNAAIDSSNTQQQQSVGAQGTARNVDIRDFQSEPQDRNYCWKDDDEVVIVINNQINKAPAEMSSATQVASGAAKDSAGGTNAAIQSSNTKQQHAVGGDSSGIAHNKVTDSQQNEIDEFPPLNHPKTNLNSKLAPSKYFDARGHHMN